ncbi:MAG: sodium:solute symporter family protein [Bacteriovoracaceae bacterium]|jgi:solute:Na+ symporter, SSS family|nr:sodium:solute symporter family protein [Bacteriovoracaceae bacterium]
MNQSQFSQTIHLAHLITPLDWIIFTLILLITFTAVFYGQYKKKNNAATEDESFLDLLLMGRKLTLPLFTATLVATWYGGIFGVTEISFTKGIFNFVTQGVFWYISYIIFAIFIVNKVSKYQAVTLPNLIGKMFGPKSSFLSAIFNFFNVLPIAYVISLGIFLQLLFGGVLWLNMLVGVIVVICYSLYGGFRAVVFSDLIQFFVMCAGVFLILILSISNFGGLTFLQENLPERYFQLTGGETIGTTLVWGFIALSTLVDPNFYQRVFAATSPEVAKKGILTSTVIWLCFDICTTFGAMYAKAVIPEAEPSGAYLIYAIQLLPSGVRGFVLAGILATILSTLDSYLFLAGTTLSYDLVPKKYKGKVILHHIGISTVGLIAVVMAVLFKGNIKTVWKTLGSYSAACLLLPVLIGYIFPNKIKDNQFVFASLLGVIFTSYWRNAPHSGFWNNVDELYAGIFATSLGLAIYPLLERIIIHCLRLKAQD